MLVQPDDPVAVLEQRDQRMSGRDRGWSTAGMFQEPAHWKATSRGGRTNSAPAGLSTTSAAARMARLCSATKASGAVSASMQRIHSRR